MDIIYTEEGWMAMESGIEKLTKILEGGEETQLAEKYLSIHSIIHTMYLQGFQNDYSNQLYVKFKESFEYYITHTITKEQFHCIDCGICRVGGRENFFQCKSVFLFDSTKQAKIMNCGRTMHVECYTAMLEQNQYRCPMCFKSVFDMSRSWERLEQEIQATAMPEEYRYEVSILCNDCNNTSKAAFHIFGHRCQHCKSYNTCVITSRENQQSTN